MLLKPSSWAWEKGSGKKCKREEKEWEKRKAQETCSNDSRGDRRSRSCLSSRYALTVRPHTELN